MELNRDSGCHQSGFLRRGTGKLVKFKLCKKFTEQSRGAENEMEVSSFHPSGLVDTVGLCRCQGRVGTCTAREIQDVEHVLALWSSAWAPTAGAGDLGKQCCLLLYLHSSWAPAFEGSWMLDMGLSGPLVGASAAVRVFSPQCSNFGRAELQFRAVCAGLEPSRQRSGHALTLPAPWAPAQAPGGPAGWWWGHPGGSQSITGT